MYRRTDKPPSESEQKQYWDTRWSRAQAEYPHAWARRRGAAILAALRTLPVDRPRIFDMGCGTGWLTEELSGLGEATGMDLSEAAMSLARSRYPRATFLAGNVLEAPVPAAPFDVIVSLEVIAHVDDQGRYLERAAQMLRPHGYLIITTVNKFVNDRMDWEEDTPGHIRYWLDRRSFRQLLTKHGFRVLRLTSVIPMGHRGILRIVNSSKLEVALSRLIPPERLQALKERMGFGWTLVALAQKER
jgi:2-polyprenyl-3-methyl-5-hydroxy-6-metoxy-1,4-benzoquinol methylase